MQELNGYREQYFVLGDLHCSKFMDDEGNLSLTEPTHARRFSTYRLASTYYEVNKDKYYDHLYPQEIRVTVELI